MTVDEAIKYCAETNKEGEVWKQCSIAPDYLISNQGRIYSLLKNEFVKFKTNEYGRKRVFLENKKAGTFRNYYVHFLVANEFIEKPKDVINEKLQVHHINNNKNDNNVDNLEWLTPAQHHAIHQVKNDNDDNN